MPTWEERAAAMRERAEASKQKRQEAQQSRDERRQKAQLARAEAKQVRDQKRDEAKKAWEEAKVNLRARKVTRQTYADDAGSLTGADMPEEVGTPSEPSPLPAAATLANGVELVPGTAVNTRVELVPDTAKNAISEPLVSELERLLKTAPLLAPASPMPTTSASGQTVDTVDPRVKTKIPDFVAESLHPSEQVLGAFSASLIDHHLRDGQFRHDKFVVTDQRIICYYTALIHKGMNQIPYSVITNIHSNRGFRHGKVIINTSSGVGLTIDGINNDDASFIERIIAGSLAGRTFIAKR